MSAHQVVIYLTPIQADLFKAWIDTRNSVSREALAVSAEIGKGLREIREEEGYGGEDEEV